jgi:adenosine kinase
VSLIAAGSIASDNLMVFPGKFSDQFVAGKLESISLSFLVDELEIRPGGVAADIAFGLGCLGLRPVLLGSVGADFADYRARLEAHNVDTTHVRVSKTRHTARFLCTTDVDQNQIASFYPGAMSEAVEIDLAAVVAAVGDVDLVVISPDDPGAMARHTEVCRSRGLPFAADPSQQVAFMDGAALRELVDGASYLFTNEYERELLQQKTGWDDAQIAARVGTWVTTLGEKGVRIEPKDTAPISVAPPTVDRIADPTGVGDAFRAGYLAGMSWQLDIERCAQIGCTLAAIVIENVGPQSYEFSSEEFLDRFGATYGPAAQDEVRAKLASTVSTAPA